MARHSGLVGPHFAILASTFQTHRYPRSFFAIHQGDLRGAASLEMAENAIRTNRRGLSSGRPNLPDGQDRGASRSDRVPAWSQGA